MNDFADAVKNKPNQTQLQTSHPVFQKKRKKPYFLDFLSFSLLFFLSSVFCLLNFPFYIADSGRAGWQVSFEFWG